MTSSKSIPRRDEGKPKLRPTVVTNDPSQLPQSDEAEQALLGSLLIDSSKAAEVFAVVKADEFYVSQWRDMAEAIHDLYERGAEIDPVTVNNELTLRGQLGEDTGLSSADTWALLNRVPHAEHATAYAQIVHDAAVRREGLRATALMAEAFHKHDDGLGALVYGQSLLKDISDTLPKPSKWQFQDFAAMRNLPRPEWLINTIIKKRTVSVFYGESGHFKSFVADSMAYSLACDIPWLNFDVAEGARVLYLAGEGVNGVRARFLALEAHHGRTPQPGRLTWYGGVPRLMDETDVLSLIDAIKAAGPFDMVVVDTFGRAAVGGDDNKTDEMAVMIDRCELIAAECETHVLLVHHKNRGGTERGNLTMRNSVETMFDVTRKDKEYRTTLHCTKQKEADEPKFEVELKEVYFGDHPDDHSLVCIPASPRASEEVEDDGLEWSDRKVLRALVNFTAGTNKAGLVKAAGVSDATLTRRLPILIDRGYVKQIGSGRGATILLTVAGGDLVGAFVRRD